MEFLHFIKKKPARLELHALEPEETWYERAYYLVLLAKELKAEVEQLRTANKQLALLAKAELPLTAEQDELLSMRDELEELRKAKTKLEKRGQARLPSEPRPDRRSGGPAEWYSPGCVITIAK